IRSYRDELSCNYSELKPHINLVTVCTSELFKVIKGQTSATDILFPNSSLKLLDGIYSGNPIANYFNMLVAYGVNAVAESIGQNRTVKILEVGAGTGSATDFVLSALNGIHSDIEYVFSDVSTAFIENARQRYKKDYPFVSYKCLDIEKNIIGQAINEEEYDIIIASNVLHATKNISDTVERLKEALRVNGWLIINEATKDQLFTTATFGMLKGWWNYEDSQLRLPHSPLLSLKSWISLLERLGFDSFAASPAEEIDEKNMNQQVIMAQKKESSYENSDKCNQVRNVKGEMCKKPAVHMAEGTKKLEERLSNIVGEALGISKEDIDTGEPFSNYGVDSIVGVELINKINSVLNILLKTTVIFDYPTIKELAKYIQTSFSSLNADDNINFHEVTDVKSTNKGKAPEKTAAVTDVKSVFEMLEKGEVTLEEAEALMDEIDKTMLEKGHA
ncbi:MAG TPA: methyltransferase, partial [Ruminiclostridium sp.]|nr:methyltransferase [Ruminiclostridium sp.]